MTKQNNKLLMKNRKTQPTCFAPFPTANVNKTSNFSYRKGHRHICGHGHRRGIGHGKNISYNHDSQNNLFNFKNIN